MGYQIFKFFVIDEGHEKIWDKTKELIESIKDARKDPTPEKCDAVKCKVVEVFNVEPKHVTSVRKKREAQVKDG